MKSSTKPSKLLYAFSGIVLVSGIILFIYILLTGIQSCSDRLDNRVVVPGMKTMELNETGKYSIYLEYQSVVDGKVFETNSANGLACSLKNIKTGETVKINNASVNTEYHFNGRSGRSLFEFTINSTGKYELAASYDSNKGEDAVLVVSKGFGMELARTIILSIVTLLVSIGGSIAIFVVTLVKRQRAKGVV